MIHLMFLLVSSILGIKLYTDPVDDYTTEKSHRQR